MANPTARGSATTRPNSTIARGPQPATTQGRSDHRTDVYTYITKIGGTEQLYDGSRAWARITMTLESAGPVAIGTREGLQPVLSGRGELLDTDAPKTLVIAKGSRVYIAATSVNRVKVEIEPLPWLEQIAGTINAIVDLGTNLLARITTRGR